MKTFLTIAFLSWIVAGAKAQNNSVMENQENEISAISTVLENYYFKGLYQGNIDLLGVIFNPGTLLFGDIKGTPYAKTLDQYLEGVKNRQSPKDSGKPFKGEILSVHVVNSIAVAEVSIQMYGIIYRDLLSFHKINGKWLIVNKMLTETN